MRTLKLLALLLGVLIAAVGLVGMAAPSVLLEFGRSLQTAGALYAVAAVRIAFGVLLWSAASASRMPRTFRVIATIVIVAGLLTPFFGVERTQAMLTWWSSQGQLFMRASTSLAVILGVFIIYAFASPRRADA
jgi:hypothetical protein